MRNRTVRDVNWLRAARDAMVPLGILAAATTWWFSTFGGLGQPVDASAYWSADPQHLYTGAANAL